MTNQIDDYILCSKCETNPCECKQISEWEKDIDFYDMLYLQDDRVIGFKACNSEDEMTEKLLGEYKKKFNQKIKDLLKEKDREMLELKERYEVMI